MQSFKKLLDTVRSKHPDLISEEAANDMLTQFDASIDQMRADALAEGQQLGFKEGYDEGKRVAADEAKRSTDELIEKLDAEQTAKLKLQNAEAEIELKIAESQNQIKEEIVDVAYAMASNIIGKEIEKGTYDMNVDDYLKKVDVDE